MQVEMKVKDSLREWTEAGQVSPESLLARVRKYQSFGQRVVTTDGCFNLLHVGHLEFLKSARSQGDVLIVGLNSDRSLRRLHGMSRLFVPEAERAAMLAALQPVDHVVVFDDPLPNDFLEKIRPNVHCKAGEFTLESLPEAQVVQRSGGEVRILALTESRSTPRSMQREDEATQTAVSAAVYEDEDCDKRTSVIEQMLAGANVIRESAYQLHGQILEASERITSTLLAGGKLLLCGNGGSAADAQHIAAEFVGRYRREREAWPAIALTADTSVLTAVSNDYTYQQVFARQVSAFGREGDVLIAISTSGSSLNVIQAVEKAKERGMFVIGLTGMRSSPLVDASDLSLRVPSAETSHIQQAHITILHTVCDLVEHELLEFEKNDNSSPSTQAVNA